MTKFEAVDNDGVLYDQAGEIIDDEPVDLDKLDKPDSVYRNIARNRTSDRRTNTQDLEIGAVGSSLLGEPIDPDKIKL